MEAQVLIIFSREKPHAKELLLLQLCAAPTGRSWRLHSDVNLHKIYLLRASQSSLSEVMHTKAVHENKPLHQTAFSSTCFPPPHTQQLLCSWTLLNTVWGSSLHGSSSQGGHVRNEMRQAVDSYTQGSRGFNYPQDWLKIEHFLFWVFSHFWKQHSQGSILLLPGHWCIMKTFLWQPRRRVSLPVASTPLRCRNALLSMFTFPQESPEGVWTKPLPSLTSFPFLHDALVQLWMRLWYQPPGILQAR